MTGLWGEAYRWLVFIAAAKVVLALLAAIYYLVARGEPREIAGKVIMGALGTVLVFWLSRVVGFSAFLRHAVLQPVANSGIEWFIRGAAATASTYLTIALFRQLFIRWHPGAWLDAWCILVMTGIVTITTPVLIDTIYGGPDVNRYLSSDILPGVLMGGIFYVAKVLLTPERSILRPRPVSSSRRLAD